jgi:hypothetical protein
LLAMPASPPSPDEETLTWTVHLARAQPTRAIAVVCVALAAAGLCLMLFHSLPFALFSLLVVVGGTAEFLFPIRYRLTEEAAEMRNLHNWRRIEWETVRKAYLLEDGVKLSPLCARTRLEPFRGVFLRFGVGEGEREAVLAAVRRFRDRARSDADN